MGGFFRVTSTELHLRKPTTFNQHIDSTYCYNYKCSFSEFHFAYKETKACRHLITAPKSQNYPKFKSSSLSWACWGYKDDLDLVPDGRDFNLIEEMASVCNNYNKEE